MTNAATMAAAYCRRGWSPIPVPLSRKAPRIRGWRDLRIGAAGVPRYFNGAPINIGVLLGEPSGWLVDVDLDCPEALALAGDHLPETQSIFGRPTKQGSHRLYVARGAKSRRFADPLGGMLVELRSTGAMTIFPESVHLRGETITWETGGKPTEIDVAELAAACGQLATACLVVRHLGPDVLDLPIECWPERLHAAAPKLGAAARHWLCHTVTPNAKAGVTGKSQQDQERHTCHTRHTASEADAGGAEESGECGTERQQITAAQRAYALAGLESEAAEVACTKPGNQSDRLNQAARKLAEFVTVGALSVAKVRERLAAAAALWENDPDRDPWTEEQILRAIESGLAAGMAHPPRDLSGVGSTAADHAAKPAPREEASGGSECAAKPADGAESEGAAAGGDDSAAGMEDEQNAAADNKQSAAEASNAASTDGRHFVSFDRYRMTATGLYFTDNDGVRHWLSGPFEVLAQTRDANGSDWGLWLRWHDSDSERHQWAMPKEALGGRREEVYRTFLREGLNIASSAEYRYKLVDYLSRVRISARARCVSRMGWHNSLNVCVYVLPDQTYAGSDLAEDVRLQTEQRTETYHNIAGTADEWRRMIGARCVGNSRLVVAVSVAFAAPLLEVVDEPSGGLHFVGNSQTGKTTALHVAGSVWGGGGKNGFLNTWRATSNGLEGVAEAHCDGLLVLDEMGEVDGREVGEIAYMLANGQGKNRARRDGSARRPAQWRLLFLSSGEVSLADKMSEAGKKPKAGQEVRLVSIDADAGAGMGLFENLHGATPAAFADALREGAATCYGAPIGKYLTALTTELATDAARVRAEIKAAKDAFIAAHVPPGASAQVRSVCGRFGLIAAAGSLATAFGLTGWPDDEADQAAAVCFQAWLDRRGSVGDYEIEQGIAQVRAFLEKHGLSRFETVGEGREVDDEMIHNRAGFRRHTKDGGWQYMALPEQWKAEIAKGHDPRALARAMVERKLIIADAEGKSQRAERIGGRAKRLYVFAPHILDDEGEAGDAGE
jgi:uncharacterized protein (DUF927 family)